MTISTDMLSLPTLNDSSCDRLAAARRDPRLRYFYDAVNDLPQPTAVPLDLAPVRDALLAAGRIAPPAGRRSFVGPLTALMNEFAFSCGGDVLVALLLDGFVSGLLGRDVETLTSALWRVGNHDRLPLLDQLAERGLVAPEVLNAVLASEWTNAGYPADLGAARVVTLLRHAGFVTDTEGLTPPTDRLLVYRGADRRAARGVCWTTNPELAAWFAERGAYFGNPQTTVFTAMVAPRGVLGVFLGRGESEVVVDPRLLSRVRELTEAERSPVQGSRPPVKSTL